MSPDVAAMAEDQMSSHGWGIIVTASTWQLEREPVFVCFKIDFCPGVLFSLFVCLLYLVVYYW